MNIPAELKYTKSHEWVQELEGGGLRVGLTDYAQEQLGDLVFINLPDVGDEVFSGAAIADVESVKAVSDVFAPATGIVAAVNEELLDTPELINTEPYSAWIVELKDVSEVEALLTAEEYQLRCEEEEE